LRCPPTSHLSPYTTLFRSSLAISLAAAGAQATPQEAGMAPSGRALQALYWEGHDALQRADWKLALERFRRLEAELREKEPQSTEDRKSTRLNSSHVKISYA